MAAHTADDTANDAIDGVAAPATPVSYLSSQAAWQSILEGFFTRVAPGSVDWVASLADVEPHAVMTLLQSAYGAHDAFQSLVKSHCLLFPQAGIQASGAASVGSLGARLSVGMVARSEAPAPKRRKTTVQSAVSRIHLRPPSAFASCPCDGDAARQVPNAMVSAASAGFSNDVLPWLQTSFTSTRRSGRQAAGGTPDPSWKAWEAIFGAEELVAALQQHPCTKSSSLSPCVWQHCRRSEPIVILDNPLPRLAWVKRARCQHGSQRACSKEDLANLAGVVCFTRKIRCTPRFARWVLDNIQDSFNWRLVRRALLNMWRTHLHQWLETHRPSPQVWSLFTDDDFLCPLAALPHVGVLKHVAFKAFKFVLQSLVQTVARRLAVLDGQVIRMDGNKKIAKCIRRATVVFGKRRYFRVHAWVIALLGCRGFLLRPMVLVSQENFEAFWAETEAVVDARAEALRETSGRGAPVGLLIDAYETYEGRLKTNVRGKFPESDIDTLVGGEPPHRFFRLRDESSVSRADTSDMLFDCRVALHGWSKPVRPLTSADRPLGQLCHAGKALLQCLAREDSLTFNTSRSGVAADVRSKLRVWLLHPRVLTSVVWKSEFGCFRPPLGFVIRACQRLGCVEPVLVAASGWQSSQHWCEEVDTITEWYGSPKRKFLRLPSGLREDCPPSAQRALETRTCLTNPVLRELALLKSEKLIEGLFNHQKICCACLGAGIKWSTGTACVEAFWNEARDELFSAQRKYEAVESWDFDRNIFFLRRAQTIAMREGESLLGHQDAILDVFVQRSMACIAELRAKGPHDDPDSALHWLQNLRADH